MDPQQISGERRHLESFLDEERRALVATVAGLSDEQSRRRLVPSRTTLSGLIKHLTFVEQAWFQVALAGRTRSELGMPAEVDRSFVLEDNDTVASLVARYEAVCAESRATAAAYDLDHSCEHHRLGTVTVRWIHLHLIREIARHAGHADILREQILAADSR